MILIIDNYDSFTYNLFQYIGEKVPEVEVYRNDKITIDEIAAKSPTHIIVSPGPGYPKDAGISIKLIRELGMHIPILGVCLGHQAIAEAFGGRVVHAKRLVHGKAWDVKVDITCKLFRTMPQSIRVGRYHSLIVKNDSLPEELWVTATTSEGEIMGLQHKKLPIYGIQFHPESILTPEGKRILANFIEEKAI